MLKYRMWKVIVWNWNMNVNGWNPPPPVHLKTCQKSNLPAVISHANLRGKNERNNHAAGRKCKNHGPSAVDQYGVLRNFQHSVCTANQADEKQKTIYMDRGRNFAGAVWYSFRWIICRVLWTWNLNHDRSDPRMPAGEASIYDSNWDHLKKFRILNSRYLPDEKNRQRSEPGDCKEQTKVSRTQAQSNSRGLFKQAYLGGTFHVFILTHPP